MSAFFASRLPLLVIIVPFACLSILPDCQSWIRIVLSYVHSPNLCSYLSFLAYCGVCWIVLGAQKVGKFCEMRRDGAFCLSLLVLYYVKGRHLLYGRGVSDLTSYYVIWLWINYCVMCLVIHRRH